MTPKTVKYPPKPIRRLFPEAYRLSAKQREVLDLLNTLPEGARTVDVAKALNIHVNTARGHLEELLEHGAIRTISSPANGRGRPSLIFSAKQPDTDEVAREYVTLIEVMAHALQNTEKSPAEVMNQAHSIGQNWAELLGLENFHWDCIEEALPLLLEKLREMGFDPAVTSKRAAARKGRDRAARDTTTITLNSCPFVVDNNIPSPFICAVHEGLIQSIVGKHDGVSLDLIPLDTPGVCSLNVRQNPEEDSPEPLKSR